MKKLIFITLLLVILSGELATGKTVRPQDSYEEYYEFVRDVKKTITIERSHKIGTEEDLVLEPGQAARLDFEANPSGVKEFIIFYDDEIVHLIYRCTDETEKEYQGTWLEPKRKKSYRGTRATGATTWLWLFYEFEPKGGKAFVKFRTTLSLSEKDQEQIKEIKETRLRKKAARMQKSGSLQERIAKTCAEIRESASQKTPYEFGTAREFTIVPEQKGVWLKCSDNAEGVEEILIGVNSKYLYIYCVLSSGSITGGGSTLGHSTGSFRQVGGSAAVGMWESKDGEVHLKFQLTNNKNVIAESWRKLDKRENFSTIIRNWKTLLGDTELVFDRLTVEQRVEAFTRLWSKVKYNFANFDLVPELNWDDVLSEYLPKVMAEQSNDEYLLLLNKCIARLKDGHTSVGSSWGNGLSMACPALRIRSVSGKAIITETVQTDEIKASGIKVGDEITHVDGRAVEELLEKDIYPYICASSPQGRDLKAYPRILWGPTESAVSLSIKTLEGTVRKVSLTRRGMLPKRRRPSGFEYRDIGNGLAYVAINTFGDEGVVGAFNEKFEEISKAKGLIIDVRKNGGGSSSNGNAIISYLIEEAIPHTLWKTPQHIAAFKAWGRPKKWFEGEPRTIEPRQGDKYDGPLVILIGNETFSAAEDFVVPLHAAGRATIVGQKSGGSTGQPLRFSFLDGKILGRICTKRDTYPDGREFVGVGIIPDVEVHPGPSDIIAGRDVTLEKAIEILKEI